MLDQGAEVLLEGVRAEGLDAAMALQDFAAEHTLARLAIDQGGGIETIWKPEPTTMRFGDIAVEVPPSAFPHATTAQPAVLVRAVTRAVGAAGAVADLFAGVGPFDLAIAARTEGR